MVKRKGRRGGKIVNQTVPLMDAYGEMVNPEWAGNQMGALNQTSAKGVRFKMVNPRARGKLVYMAEW